MRWILEPMTSGDARVISDDHLASLDQQNVSNSCMTSSRKGIPGLNCWHHSKSQFYMRSAPALSPLELVNRSDLVSVMGVELEVWFGNLAFGIFFSIVRISAIMVINDSAPERSECEMMVMVKCNGDVIHHPDEETDLSCSSPETKINALVSNHPLKYVWTYWYLNDQRDKSWENDLKLYLILVQWKNSGHRTQKYEEAVRLTPQLCHQLIAIYICIVIEEDLNFWNSVLYVNIRPPSLLPTACDYSVFKKIFNRCGKFRKIPKIDKSRHHDLLDVIWLEVLMAVIGQQFGKYTADICGVVVNIRNKGSKISIWTTDCNNDESNCKIGEILKQKLMNPDIDSKIQRPLFDMLRYEDHQEVQNKSSSSVKAKHIITASD
ncbi:Eukaryotic translation initiation factor 4E-1 [Dirofilaria immitis]|nr:Eukaryotic translation initiation factor 4E-1 [Dirofilaria immitis]